MNSNSSGRNRRIEHGSIAHLRNKLSRIVRNSLSSRFIITSTWLVPSSSFPFACSHCASSFETFAGGERCFQTLANIADRGCRREEGRGKKRGNKVGWKAQVERS